MLRLFLLRMKTLSLICIRRSPEVKEVENRMKRTRWDNNDNDERRVVRVDPPLRRPPFVPSRARTASCSGPSFAPPRQHAPVRAHARSRTTAGPEQCAEFHRQDMLAKLVNEKYDHVIFIDLDNWVNFFGHLTTHLPSKVTFRAFLTKKCYAIRETNCPC